MSKTKFDTKTRVCLWKANDCKCFYCSEPVSFVDLEIDHIIAEHISPDEYNSVKQRLKLRPGLELNSLNNLVPTHHRCNNRKSGDLLPDETLLFYLELWNKRQKKIQDQLTLYSKTANRDKQLIMISRIIDAGDISKEERDYSIYSPATAENSASCK
jgi:5-methylcytosine-specific restriction endonuclease McrA